LDFLQIKLAFHPKQSVHHVPSIKHQRKTQMSQNQIQTILTLIAHKHLGIETLETRKSDGLDFHDSAVWCIRDALEEAFKAGVELGASMPKATESEIGNT
jgi:hypothetical protein